MTRRAHTLASVAAVATLSLAACSSAATGSGGGSEPESAIAIGLTSGVESIDPHAASTVRSSTGVAAAVYSSLVAIDADQNVLPEAAERWEQIDSTTWRFHLDPDAVFSDGETPLDAGTVVWNFERLLDPANALSVAGYLKTITGAVKVDDHTVDVTLSGPDVSVFLALAYVRFLDPTWTESHDPNVEAFGSGPYVVESFSPSGDIVLRANENYWGEPPAIDTVTYHVYGDATAEANALIAGEIQLGGDIEPRDVERIAATDGIETVNAASIRAAFLKLNTEVEPTDDVRVRQALNYAVDKQAIIDSILLGTTEQSQNQVLTEYFLGYNDALEPYPYDPDRARELLAEAGHADGLTLTVDVPSGTYVEGENITTAIGQQLAEVGVTLEQNVIPFATYMERYTETHELSQTAYLTQSQMSTDRFLGLFETESVYAYWSNPEFDELVLQGRYAETEEEAAAAYEQAVEIMREEAPVLFLFPQPKVYGLSEDLVWDVRDDEWILPQDISLEP